MRKPIVILTAGLFIIGSFFSCTLADNRHAEEEEAFSPASESRISVILPSELDNRHERAFNTVMWSAEDQPVLLQCGEDERQPESPKDDACRSYLPVTADCSDPVAPVFSYDLIPEKGEFRYWLCRSGGVSSSADAVLSAFPLGIPAEQTPGVDGIDPAADVLVSGMSFSLSQEYMAQVAWKPELRRLNAIGALRLNGIPSGHVLQSVVLETHQDIVGEKPFNVAEQTLAEGASSGRKLVLKIEGELGKTVQPDGSRLLWISLWPESVNNQVVKAATLDPQGNAHEFTSRLDVFSGSVFFDAGLVTELPAEMREDLPEPVLPPTPSGPVGIVEGGEPSTKALFGKMMSWPDNAITAVNGCRTHRIGYEGVLIHEAEIIQYKEPVHLWVLEADPSKVSFALGTPFDRNVAPAPTLQTVSGQAASAAANGKKVIAAINGDAWGSHGGTNTFGIMIKDGICLKNKADRPNTLADKDTFYSTDMGEVGIADEPTFKALLQTCNVENAIGGWYRLISQGGEPYAQPGIQEGDAIIRDKSKTTDNIRAFLDRNPRTFLGITEDRVYLIVADGRNKGFSVGLTVNACARICRSIGCRRAINLDGGGSTAMVKKQGNGYVVLNRPSDGSERRVANSLLVLAR